jgi:serine/threonine protein phosphatase 1
LDPTLPVVEQTDSFWWGNRRFNEIDAPYFGFKRVVRGYEKHHGGVTIKPYTVTLDGGCGFGGTLEAACLTLDGKIADQVSIPA